MTDPTTAFLRQFNVEILEKTPARLTKAYAELLEGYAEDPGEILTSALEDNPAKDLVVTIHAIPFASLCAHHVLPFQGSVAIAYRPSDKIVGVSKFPRAVRALSRRLNTQEGLGQAIARAVYAAAKAEWVVVIIDAAHACMALRGAECPARLTTQVTVGGPVPREEVETARALMLRNR